LGNPSAKKDFLNAVAQDHGEIPFGQLKPKYEAAGKVRVFAMVDF
jgi:hypothetical protein